MPNVVVMLACNDPDNGVHTGYCDAVELLPRWRDGDPLLKLDGVPWRCQCQAITAKERVWCAGTGYEGLLRFGRLRVPYLDAQSWVGNWCWDAVVLHVEHAAILVATLCASPRWGIEEGASVLYDAWQAGLKTAGEWEALLRTELAAVGV